MSYITAQLIINGALEEDIQFDTEYEFDTWFECEIKPGGDMSRRIPLSEEWEVFRIVHEHPPTNECMCVQYLTDHSPYWTNKEQ